jgi:hypothetical protein
LDLIWDSDFDSFFDKLMKVDEINIKFYISNFPNNDLWYVDNEICLSLLMKIENSSKSKLFKCYNT